MTDADKVCERIADVVNKKKKHLSEYAAYINSLAKRKESHVFYELGCAECDSYDRQLQQLQKELVQALNNV